MKKLLLSTALVAAAALAAPAMAAHDLPLGDQGSPLPSPLPPGTGAKLADTGVQILSATGPNTALSVMMRAAVFASTATAADAMTAGFSEGDATLDFVYQITNNSGSTTSIDGLTFANFNGFTVLAWDSLDGFDVFMDGDEEADSARRNFDGDVLGVNFGTTFFPDVDAGANPLINPGETSSVFLFRVNATNFMAGTFTAQNGLTINGRGFAPAPIPEPATWAMLIGGFGLVGGAMRARSRKTHYVTA